MASAGLWPLEQLESLQKKGLEEILAEVHQCQSPSDDFASATSPGGKDLKLLLYHLCILAVQQKINQETIISYFKEIQKIRPDLKTKLADVLFLLDLETDDREINKESNKDSNSVEELQSSRQQFIIFARSCVDIIGEAVLKQRLEFETLESLGLITSSKAFTQKYVKIKTKLFYKQQKFNLLREESEGYAKLIVELNKDINEASDAQKVLGVINSLIAEFDLDPNRVIDFILNAFEFRPQQPKFFVQLIKSYNCESSTLCSTLGFKFNCLKKDSGSISKNLYFIAAILIQEGLIAVEDLYPHLAPANDEFEKDYKQMLVQARSNAKKVNVVNPSDKGTSIEPEMTKDIEETLKNQKIGLCFALLSLYDWSHSRFIFNQLPMYSVASHQLIAVALCKILHTTIDPIYKKFAPKAANSQLYSQIKKNGGPARCDSFTDLMNDVLPICCHLGPYIYVDQILIIKLIRIGKGYLLEFASSNNQKDALWGMMLDLLNDCLIPSLSLTECNASLGEELWDMIKIYPYTTRYHLYYHWKAISYNNHKDLLKAKTKTLDSARYIMKRITKENVKPSGRQLGKLSHSNPGILFDYALSSASKQRSKHEESTTSEWLQSLATFCGLAFKKYTPEVTGLLQYITNQLKNEKSYDLPVLQEMITKMSGIEISVEITQDQLEAQFGGDTLVAEGSFFTNIRNVKKSSQRLRDALLTENLAVPLCLLLGQQREKIIFDSSNDIHIKLIGKLYDQLKYEKLNEKGNDKERNVEAYIKASESYMGELIESANSMLPASTWNDISIQLYVTFWSLSMYDIYTPTARYESEINKLTLAINSIDVENIAPSKRKKEKERLTNLMEKLRTEEKKQKEHTERVKVRLSREKDTWFPLRTSKKDLRVLCFLQTCIFPRGCFSEADAVYCAKFIFLVHSLKSPNFSTLLLFDKLFSDISYIVSCLTENEAHHYGRFLCCMLETIDKWHRSKEKYDKECSNYPGFATIIRKNETSQSDTNKSNQLEFEDYRRVCRKWHYKLTRAFASCLVSEEYIQIRNALIIMTKIVQYFPVIDNLGKALKTRLDKLQKDEKDKRPDLYALATGYAGRFLSKVSQLIPEEKFYVKEVTVKSQSSKSASSSSSSIEIAKPKASNKPSEHPTSADSNVNSTSNNDQTLVKAVATGSKKLKKEATNPDLASNKKEASVSKNSSSTSSQDSKKSKEHVKQSDGRKSKQSSPLTEEVSKRRKVQEEPSPVEVIKREKHEKGKEKEKDKSRVERKRERPPDTEIVIQKESKRHRDEEATDKVSGTPSTSSKSLRSNVETTKVHKEKSKGVKSSHKTDTAKANIRGSRSSSPASNSSSKRKEKDSYERGRSPSHNVFCFLAADSITGYYEIFRFRQIDRQMSSIAGSTLNPLIQYKSKYSTVHQQEMDESERQRDICNSYMSTLTELTNNSKPVINVLTILADENKEFATHIVRILEGRLREVNIEMKLPVLYLIDSIVKNIGGQYRELFTQNLVSNFFHVFNQANDKVKHSLCKLRNTWEGVFPPKKLKALDNKMREPDRKSPSPPKNIHVNPRFIEYRHPAPRSEFRPRPYNDFRMDRPMYDAEDGHRHPRDVYGPPHEFMGRPRGLIDDWRPPGPQHPEIFRPPRPVMDWPEQRPRFNSGPPRPYKAPRKRKEEDPRIDPHSREKRGRHRATVSTEIPKVVKPTESLKRNKNQQKKLAHNTSTQQSKVGTINKDKDEAQDIQSLLQNLIKNGILPSGESPSPISNVIPQLSLKEEDLKKNYVGVIEKLYKKKQCSMCGDRFSSDGARSDYSNHLDWHFRYNSRRNDSKRNRSRPWYFLLEDWTTCEDLDDPDKGESAALRNRNWIFNVAFSKLFEDAKMNESSDEKILESLQCNLIPNSEDQVCALCHEAFTDKFWEENDEEWHFRNAKLVDGKAYHASCYDDAIGNPLLDVDSNSITKKLNEDTNADDIYDDKTQCKEGNKTGSLEQTEQT
ncbi:uncharacterized protein TRIADDRAFT_56575 [Trichoplax adhaerens]|uniref:THO complex subunit 2 n=1 Tax=Trichoplax adhaerens TaxID=10228 RepID=B3RYJ0_TRIAD|nr:hypothetical protein TRIADDRAFT_56575 [Trichoplax adhaerens]EDV24606.1 hypothetical protein TRIADDRAFT_56575 [Trichoplax adhaerens]|eukprot:XP_002112496.1 hypothetical protein TRIADDRAFT_56575 [Trichoplax adhaerens]